MLRLISLEYGAFLSKNAEEIQHCFLEMTE